jgi:hypothetical protein
LPIPREEEAVSSREESSSPLFKIIAVQFEELAMRFEALTEQDQGGVSVEPKTPQGEEAERPLDWLDLVDCSFEASRAQRACRDAGGNIVTCYTTRRLAEAACLKAKLEEPEERK